MIRYRTTTTHCGGAVGRLCLALMAASACGQVADPAPKAAPDHQIIDPAPTGSPASKARPLTADMDDGVGPTSSADARALLLAIRTPFRNAARASNTSPDSSVLPAGEATTFRRVSGGLSPQFATSSGSMSTRVLLPAQARDPIRLEDSASGASIDATLAGAREVSAQTADGYLIYRHGHSSGATVLHRVSPTGVEDYLSFDTRPLAAAVNYALKIRSGIAGLRVVDNTLEMLDAGGAPRLRVEPPYVIDADGARTEATLTVEDCAVDSNPAAPWNRPVTAPGHLGCAIRISWSDSGVRYPAVLDPRWTSTTNTMTASRQQHTATLLPSGKVLVAGGNSGTAALSSAELFDRTTGTWAATGSRPVPT